MLLIVLALALFAVVAKAEAKPRVKKTNLNLYVYVSDALPINPLLERVVKESLREIHQAIPSVRFKVRLWASYPHVPYILGPKGEFEKPGAYFLRGTSPAVPFQSITDPRGVALVLVPPQRNYIGQGFAMGAAVVCGWRAKHPVGFSTAFFDRSRISSLPDKVEERISFVITKTVIIHEILHILGALHVEYEDSEVVNVMTPGAMAWVGERTKTLPILRRTKRQVLSCLKEVGLRK